MSTFSLQLRDAILRRQWPEICCSSIPAAATPKLEEGNVSNAKSKRGTGAIGAASARLISMGHGWFSRAERSWHRCLAMHAQLGQGEELIIWVRGKNVSCCLTVSLYVWCYCTALGTTTVCLFLGQMCLLYLRQLNLSTWLICKLNYFGK